MESENTLKLAVVVCFMDEAQHLPALLDSIAAQTRAPAQLLLVDDGSRDESYEIAAAFAREHEWARALRRPVKPKSKDRLARAAELVAFQWAVDTLREPWDIVAKMDGDLTLGAELFEAVCERFAARPLLGVSGPFLSIVLRDGTLQREDGFSEHVRGATKFYRRECFQQLAPLPPILGWDTIDELRARSAGWTVESFELASGDCVHLRPTGVYDGRLRTHRREGRCAWGYRAHPLWVLLGGVYRTHRRPYLVGGVNYVWGWALAALTRQPRAERALGAHPRRRELARLRARLREIALARGTDL